MLICESRSLLVQLYLFERINVQKLAKSGANQNLIVCLIKGLGSLAVLQSYMKVLAVISNGFGVSLTTWVI